MDENDSALTAIETAEERYKNFRIEELGETAGSLVSKEWDHSILPALRTRAVSSQSTPEQYQKMWERGWQVTEQLFDALHSNSYVYTQVHTNQRPTVFWDHQALNLLRTDDPTRGFDIDKDELLSAATVYLSHPAIRTNRLDWLFLDTIVFQELDRYGAHVFTERAGTGVNLAAAFANHSLGRFYIFKVLFWVLGLALIYVAPAAVVYYLYTNEHSTAAAVIAGLWVLFLAFVLVTYPIRRRIRRKAAKLLQHLADLYRLLADSTISPRKLKESLDVAAAAGVVLDGAVFTIVDRLIARDATAFIPTEKG
jgi:hypothetical protein